MGFVRTCFDTDMAFDQKGELVARIRMYWADPGAKMFPDYHLFGADLDFMPHQLDALGPGEIARQFRTYYDGAMPGYFPGTGNFCGPLDWWQNGVPSDAPRLPYSDNGIPACCPQPPCQPWWYDPVDTRSLRVTGFTLTLFNFNNLPFFSTFETLDGNYYFQPTTTQVTGCFGTDSTMLLVGLIPYPDVNLLLLDSYDPATYTGKYVAPPGSSTPPDFAVYFTYTPT